MEKKDVEFRRPIARRLMTYRDLFTALARPREDPRSIADT